MYLQSLVHIRLYAHGGVWQSLGNFTVQNISFKVKKTSGLYRTWPIKDIQDPYVSLVDMKLLMAFKVLNHPLRYPGICRLIPPFPSPPTHIVTPYLY